MTNNKTFSTDNEQPKHHQRTIRSFVLRQGRLTKGQEQALINLWPQFGIEYQANQVMQFDEAKPVTLEIGFGMGASLVEMAKNAPEKHFIGLEVHKPGVGACLMALEENKLKNLNIMNHDAVDVITNMIADNSLSRVQIFFPDPWHKARHNKRRLVQPAFVELIRQKLKPNGMIHLATDWQNYAEHMLKVMTAAEGWQNLSTSFDYVPKPADRPTTKFEQRGKNLGHGVWDLQFIKKQ